MTVKMDDENSLVEPGKGHSNPLSKKKKVGNYLLGKVIGEGSFSKVRHGIHIIAKEKVAVKIVAKKAVLLRDYVKKGVRREAVLLQKLEHPNIVRLYEIMETENSYYLVLEMAESGDFIKYLSVNKFLHEHECQRYIRQMVSALDHMHMSNITHRDLKLENILLDKDHNLKIIDFGFSNVFFGDTSLSTQCGSPVYAAPEIFCNKKYGPAVDVWSMGVCMYAMLTGKLPFMPAPDTNLTLLHALILRGASIPEYLSHGCADLLSRMLRIDAHERIRVDDIMRHRWILENHDTPLVTRQPPIGKLYPHIPKVPVVKYMTNVFTFPEDEIFHSVMERKMNAVAATYHLLQKRFDAGHLLVGAYTLNTNSFDLTHSAYTRGETNHAAGRGVELPQLRKENTFMSEAGTKGTSNTYKSYIQLLKDSKNRSAQLPRTNSMRQKELSLRRYKTKTEISKNTRTQEESVGFLNDFVLTYAKNEQVNVPQSKKTEGGFEWEQTFVFNKPKRKQRPEVMENIKYGRIKNDSEEPSLLVGDDGRGAVLIGEAVRTSDDFMLELKAPPTTPATFFVDNKFVNLSRQNTRLSDINQSESDKGETGNDTKSGCDDSGNEQPRSAFQRQKTRLARGVTMLNRKSGNVIPITQPKALTPRDSKAVMDELDNPGITGQGRRLVERSKTFNANNDDVVHSIWTRNTKTASSQRSSINQDYHNSSLKEYDAHDLPTRTVDANGILQLPQIVSQPPPLLELRPPPSPPSPPKRTIIDGVTDVIKIHITGSAKH